MLSLTLLLFPSTGCIARTVSSPNQHLLRTDDVISCCLDLSAPSISFRINGQPVQGMFENFNIDGLFFPVVSFSAGIKLVLLCCLVCFYSYFSYFHRGLSHPSLTLVLCSEMSVFLWVSTIEPHVLPTYSLLCGTLQDSPAFRDLKLHTLFSSLPCCFVKEDR